MVVIPFQLGTNAERSRRRNRQAVLGQVCAAGTVGRAEIARALALTTQTVSNIIADLVSDGMLLEKGRLTGGRGLPAMQYGLNPEGGFALGIEVRPDAIFAALLDMQGKQVSTERTVLTGTEPDVVLAEVAAIYMRTLSSVPLANDRMLGAGIVMPGPFGVTGISGMGSDLIGWQEVDPKALFSETIGLPVILSNDANAAAMAERIHGVARNIPSFAYLYFGTGLGLGLVHQGQLIRGASGNAGEIGHIPIPGGKLEDALSRLSVQRHLAAVGKKVTDINALHQLFKHKDPDLMAWLDRANEALGHAIAIVENMFDPQTIILGGAMPDTVLDYFVTHAPLPDVSVSNRPNGTYPRLTRGASGRMTATLGAATLVLNQTLTAPLFHAD